MALSVDTGMSAFTEKADHPWTFESERDVAGAIIHRAIRSRIEPLVEARKPSETDLLARGPSPQG